MEQADTIHQTATHHIANWAKALDAASVPAVALALAKKALLDTLAVSLSGSQLAAAGIVSAMARETGQRDGPCSVIGQGFKTDVLSAALANGTAAHAELFDDNSEPMLSHPSASLFSALLPLGQMRLCSGRDVLQAYVAGFEINVALGRRVNPKMYENGWHVTRTLGVLGATAACCKLIGLEPEPSAAALGIAASLASGIRQNFGTMTMALHAGLTARDSVQAALMAEKGFSSDSGALDGRYGFFRQFVGHQPEPLTLGHPFELVTSGIIFKPYPSGAPTHAAVRAALTLHEKLGDRVRSAARIVCEVHPWSFMTLREGVPADTLRARVSLGYCVAAALGFGALGSAQFTDEALDDPLVQKLMGLIEIRESPDLPDNGLFPAAVEVQLTDGEIARVRCDVPLGAPANPMSDAELDRKFYNCASVVLDAPAIERTRGLIQDIDRLADVGELCSALEGGAQL
ncbi:MAG: MmgE/PrpD family protein [Alphaproteobacteria bacterium]|nr:MmgE/PrpD family protein [Alphaproteobacteria bacterium]